jgi:hypothetical protein
MDRYLPAVPRTHQPAKSRISPPGELFFALSKLKPTLERIDLLCAARPQNQLPCTLQTTAINVASRPIPQNRATAKKSSSKTLNSLGMS